jgi:hypothetical protein
VQADIAAREAGSPLIVSLEEGQIRVIITQPLGIYKRASSRQRFKTTGYWPQKPVEKLY